MNHIRVNSSNIFSIGYEKGTKTLEVEFKTGAIYQYYNVPQAEYEALMSASSHGSYFSRNIRNYYTTHRIK